MAYKRCCDICDDEMPFVGRKQGAYTYRQNGKDTDICLECYLDFLGLIFSNRKEER